MYSARKFINATLITGSVFSDYVAYSLLWEFLLDSIACTQFIRCGLLLQMSHVAWSVCLCVLGTRVSCANDG